MSVVLERTASDLVDQIDRFLGRSVQFIQDFSFAQDDISQAKHWHIILGIVIISTRSEIFILFSIGSSQFVDCLCFRIRIDSTYLFHRFRYDIISGLWSRIIIINISKLGNQQF